MELPKNMYQDIGNNLLGIDLIKFSYCTNRINEYLDDAWWKNKLEMDYPGLDHRDFLIVCSENKQIYQCLIKKDVRLIPVYGEKLIDHIWISKYDIDHSIELKVRQKIDKIDCAITCWIERDRILKQYIEKMDYTINIIKDEQNISYIHLEPFIEYIKGHNLINAIGFLNEGNGSEFIINPSCLMEDS